MEERRSRRTRRAIRWWPGVVVAAGEVDAEGAGGGGDGGVAVRVVVGAGGLIRICRLNYERKRLDQE